MYTLHVSDTSSLPVMNCDLTLVCFTYTFSITPFYDRETALGSVLGSGSSESDDSKHYILVVSMPLGNVMVLDMIRSCLEMFSMSSKMRQNMNQSGGSAR